MNTPLPATLKKLPSKCIVISYDFEALFSIKGKPFVKGSTMSVGAIAAIWGKPGTFWGKSSPFAFPPVLGDNRTFFITMKADAKIPDEAKAEEFWKPHPVSFNWSNSGSTTPEDAMCWFINWMLALHDHMQLPLVMVARPHDYDGRIFIENVMQIPAEERTVRNLYGNRSINDALELLQFADCAELYAKKHGIPVKQAQIEFKERFLPQEMPHEPTMDSMVQLAALFASLNSIRKEDRT